MAGSKENFINYLIIEIRPLLRCCNFFIKTNKLTKLDTFEIKIRPDCVVFTLKEFPSRSSSREELYEYDRYDSSSSYETESDCEESVYCKVIPTKNFFKLVPDSLSTLKSEGNMISFRVLTEPSSGASGDTYEEFFSQNPVSIRNVRPCQKIKLQSDVNVKFLCHNCKNAISKADLSFDRILELPSENIDMSDWFCHDENGHCNSDKSVRKVRTFEAFPRDILYKMCYFKIDSGNFDEKFVNFNKKRGILHCNRCLFWLGTKADSSFTIWNSSILLQEKKSDDNVSPYHLFSYDKFPSTDIALDDFIYCIKKTINESVISGEIRTMPKILITCRMTDRETKRLLLWILDAQLDVIKSDSANCSKNTHDLSLSAIKTTKLLYKLIDGDEKVASDEPSYFNIEMSKSMFTSGISHLHSMSLYIPKDSRTSNGFNVTYLYI